MPAARWTTATARGARAGIFALCLALTHCAGADGAAPTVVYHREPKLSAVAGVPSATVMSGAGASNALGMPMDGLGAAGAARNPAALGSGGSAPAALGTGGTPNTTGSGGMGAAGTGATAGTSGGMGGAGGGAGNSPAPALTLTELAFEFTTKSYGGNRAPQNIGAVWVEDSSGKWIYTLEYWGSIPNDQHLSRYVKSGGPDYAFNVPGELQAVFKPGYVTQPPPDVLTGATLDMHKKHAPAWNFKDKGGAVVADGMYRIVIEISEQEMTEKSMEVPFMKGSTPSSDMPPDGAIATAMKLTLQ